MRQSDPTKESGIERPDLERMSSRPDREDWSGQVGTLLVHSEARLARYALSLEAERDALREVVFMALPVLGGHARGFAQEALIRGCELVGSKPEDWTQHPELMERRRAVLDLERPE